MVPDGGSDRGRVDRVVKRYQRVDHLQVLAGQQFSWTRDIDRVSRQLHAVLRSAERRGTHALAGGQEWKRETPRGEALADGVPETAAKVTKIVLLTPVDVLADAA